MAATMEVIIIGGGQAGLAASRHLQQRGVEHLVLEAASEPGSAWRKRWDSFTLVTPNFLLNLPGAEYHGSNPEAYLSRSEILAYLDAYASGKPVQYNTRVEAVEASPDGQGFRLETSQGPLAARQVILATGAYQNPKFPSFARDLPVGILQIPSEQYRNPEALPQGAVLVVGSGQSGCQIAEELLAAGRRVYLSAGRAGRVPRRYRGHDSLWWLQCSGFFDMTPDMLPSPQAKFTPNPQVTGKDGGHDLNLHQFARDGMILLGHINGFSDGNLILTRDLYKNLAWGDEVEVELIKRMDDWIQQNEPDAPPAGERMPLKDGFSSPERDSLNIQASGVRTIIWACGYTNDYSLLHLPVLDESGWPVQNKGLTQFAGLYFLGLPWMARRKSPLFLGVGEDAANIADQVVGLVESSRRPGAGRLRSQPG